MTYAWFDLGNGREVYRRVDTGPAPQRSDLPRPMVITDTMDPVQSAADGKWYTSKSTIRAGYKAHGLVEVGNDPARLRVRQQRQPDRQAIRDALKTAKAAAEAR